MYHPFIVGDVIYLRGLEEADLDKEYFQWFNDQENDVYTNHAVWPNTPEKMREFYDQVTQYRNDLVLAIIDKKSEKHIGNASLHRINWIDRHSKFGIIIGAKEAHSKGHATEAAKLLAKYAFDKLNLHRISLGVHEDNEAAIRVYEKVGFIVEGRQKDHFLRNGKYFDIVCMAMINKDKV
ncbi:MAG: GNAT family N-acetyltransferase [Parcubacteria group bacterium]|jgi:RimJ/RimL family protein N-acetyltransferase|nr:GNAT family N-acetyltransferase [Parcubacteria group bacterium]|tara:strand:- start:242 stop:781 length:540 start_codon:yes stop_codon:yes gene_type:complete